MTRLRAGLVLCGAFACALFMASALGPRQAAAHGSIRVPSGTEIYATQIRRYATNAVPVCTRSALLGDDLVAAGLTLIAKGAEIELLCEQASGRVIAVATSIEGKRRTFEVVPTTLDGRTDLKLKTDGLTVVSLSRAGHGAGGSVALKAAPADDQGGGMTRLEIASGTKLGVRINTPVGTIGSREGEPFVATLTTELKDVSGILVASPGARAYGRVTGILRATAGSATPPSITLELTQVNPAASDTGAVHIQTDPVTLNAEFGSDELSLMPGSELGFVTHSVTAVGP